MEVLGGSGSYIKFLDQGIFVSSWRRWLPVFGGPIHECFLQAYRGLRRSFAGLCEIFVLLIIGGLRTAEGRLNVRSGGLL